jgi:hypothetical protein
MEQSIFPLPAVAERLNKMVEARLHSDAYDKSQRAVIVKLQDELAGSRANPYYLVIDPKTDRILARQPRGTPHDEQEFIDFLDQALSAAGNK